ncbi:MAG: glycoside hydrolase family 57 protein [Candidatus Omnitrophica bacterium]|nr:glycoside hydrolase family 57 protein [Candidatus Omnitrophota bacterium]
MLYLAFLWHMHQPYYRNLLTGEVYLPWVRLHGIKDYLDMLIILERYPKIKANFNLVPSLIDQLEGYTQGMVKDVYLEISRKNAEELTTEDKIFILSKFFTLNWHTMLKPYPRYSELLNKRGEFLNSRDVSRALKNFTLQDFRDLITWFNLSWFDPYFKEHIPELKELVNKGKRFTEEEKNLVLEKQIEILKQILPKYKALEETGQIEISVTPYYHPIMPLILDSDASREALPNIPLPSQRIQFPEDLTWQIESAVEKYRGYFGKRPQGMWPSEGSVSEAILPFLMKAGINWIASDEEILWRSLKHAKSDELLYQPYLLERNQGRLNIVFRNHTLSDLIGFVYHHWNHKDAVEDFLGRLRKIRDTLPKNRNYLLPIILDGENAWEYYQRDGWDFLNLLYTRLSEEEGEIVSTTISGFLSANPPKENIGRLFAGSWINGNFSIWIGQEEKNLSWDYLFRTRKNLVEFLKNNPQVKDSPEAKLAWQNIYAAEGSDWNWWYGPEHVSVNNEEFDKIYRTHLANVYITLGREIPEFLKVPILTQRLSRYLEPTALIHPQIDGEVNNYYEWVGAGFLDLTQTGTNMHKVSSLVKKVWFGFNLEDIFLRLDLDLPPEEKTLKLFINIFPKEAKLEIPLEKSFSLAVRTWQKQSEIWQEFPLPNKAAFVKIMEIKFNYLNLGLGHGEETRISLMIQDNEHILEEIPPQGALKLVLPTPDFEAWQWSA